MKKVILIILIVFSAICSTGMVFLAADILDGRDHMLKTSPFIGVDTTSSALLIVIILMLASMFTSGMLLWVMEDISKENTTKSL